MLRRERIEAVWQDLSFTARQLRRSPGFTATVIVTFALAIAANATMFGIIDRLLLRPPAFLSAPDRTHRVYLTRRLPEGEDFIANNITYTRYRELSEWSGSFDATAAFFTSDVVIGRGEEARELKAGLVSASFWPFFDARPVIGRFFAEAEDETPAGDPVAVLGHSFWESRFGADPAVLGTQLDVGGRQYTIIGVAPKGFSGMAVAPPAVFVPITAAAHDMFGDMYFQGHNVSWMEMLVRRRPGVTLEAADADLTNAYRRSMAAAPNARPLEQSQPRGAIGPVLFDRGPKRGDSARVATWLGGMSLIVLLIAAANVANLLLARARRRGREIAVRVALGVGRGRLVGQLLIESVLLGLAGGAAGLLLSHWGGGVLRAILLPDVDWSGALFDRRMLAATAAAALLAGVLAGLAPAIQSTRPTITDALKTGVREGNRRTRTRAALLVAQVALSLVLLAGAGLFVRSLYNVRTVDMGFDADRLLHVTVEMRGTVLSRDESIAFADRVLARSLELPWVENATHTRSVPFYMSWEEDLHVPGVDSIGRFGRFVTNAVSPGYFTTTGTPIIRGRGITAEDHEGSMRVAVVSESMARALWPGEDALGKCIKVRSDTMPCSTVVGTARDLRRDSFDETSPMLQYYLSAAQVPRTARTNILVRTRGRAAEQGEPVRRALQLLMPGAAYVSTRPIQTLVDQNIRPWQLGATMFAVFGGLALVLAAVGLYGVIAFDVAQRTHELGVRVALGARARHVLRLVVGEGVRLAAFGIAIGVALALIGGRWIGGLLFRVTPYDPAVLVGGGVILLLVAVTASILPAMRALRVDPNIALRAE